MPYWPEFLTRRFHANPRDALTPLSPFSLLSEGVPFYEWIHSPGSGRSGRGQMFNFAMRGMADTEGLAFLPFDYPFSQLSAGALVIDVGGGIGSVPALLLPQAPHLRFIVQDLASVISQALSLAEKGTQMRRWIDEGKVAFIVHSCFEAQPPDSHGAIFLLKNML